MKSTAFKALCRLLIVSLFALPLHPAMAGMIATDDAISAAAGQSDRAIVLNTLARSDVANQLQSQGVDPEAAKARVAAMTEPEVHALAGQIQSAPAGGHVSGWLIAAIVAVILAGFYFYR
jgi:hypothetical protein